MKLIFLPTYEILKINLQMELPFAICNLESVIIWCDCLQMIDQERFTVTPYIESNYKYLQLYIKLTTYISNVLLVCLCYLYIHVQGELICYYKASALQFLKNCKEKTVAISLQT